MRQRRHCMIARIRELVWPFRQQAQRVTHTHARTRTCMPLQTALRYFLEESELRREMKEKIEYTRAVYYSAHCVCTALRASAHNLCLPRCC